MKRWYRAQEYERSWWEHVAAGIAAGVAREIDYHGWKASEMDGRLAGLLNDDRKADSRVLEIGSGPVGIVSFLKWGERYAIDPLEDFYRSNETLTKYRNPQVRYTKGMAEQLPWSDGFFHLVILDNVLDHVQAAERVLDEVHRVLAENGLMYFAMNVRTAWGSFVHSILAKLQIDKGHPYSFTSDGIRRFINDHGFAIRLESVSDYDNARNEDISSPSWKTRTKGYVGLSEFVYYAVYSKEP